MKLEHAVDRENVKDVEDVLNKYPDIIKLEDAFYEDGVFNIGTRAAWRGDLPMLKMFHRRGGNLNSQGKSSLDLTVNWNLVNEGYPPVMWCAIRGHLECLKFLIEEVGVDVDICDSEGLTPLDNAVIQARYDCALYLKGKGQLLKSSDFYKTKNDKFLFD